MAHTQQLNDLTAGVSMDAYFGRSFRWRAPVPFNIHPRSENQLIEGRLAGLIQNPYLPVARTEFLNHLDGDYHYGHQGGEFATPSHAPHWYRAMSVALWWAIEHRFTHGEVFTRVVRWWSCDAWVRNQYRVPSGPLADHIIGWGARFDNNGDNDTRNVVDALLTGRPTGKPKKYFVNAARFADTFAALVIQSLINSHADILATNKPEKPVIAYDLTITRDARGLDCECRNPQGADPRRVSVDFEQGKVIVPGGPQP